MTKVTRLSSVMSASGSPGYRDEIGELALGD